MLSSRLPKPYASAMCEANARQQQLSDWSVFASNYTDYSLVAVAKEMLVVIWFMVNMRNSYRTQNLQRVETKLKRMNTLAESGLQAA